jgi:hypothetical protein
MFKQTLVEDLSGVIVNMVFDLTKGRTQEDTDLEIHRINSELEFKRKSFIASLRILLSDEIFDLGKEAKFENGMNTPGILFDRLTILACKRVLASSSTFESDQTDSQIHFICKALSQAGFARSPILAKEATPRIANSLDDAAESLFRLIGSNLLMWINQDLLYTKDVMSASEFRLRNYIAFFGKANRCRNLAIESLDIWLRAARNIN